MVRDGTNSWWRLGSVRRVLCSDRSGSPSSRTSNSTLVAVVAVVAVLASTSLLAPSPVSASPAKFGPGNPAWEAYYQHPMDRQTWGPFCAGGGGGGGGTVVAAADGVPACGPTGSQQIAVNGRVSIKGFESVELAERFLKVRWKLTPLPRESADQLVSNYGSNDDLPIVANGTTGVAPQANDVISFSTASNFTGVGGYTGVVVGNDLTDGSGSVEVLGEDDQGTASLSFLDMTDWVVQPFLGLSYIEWLGLQDPATQTQPGATSTVWRRGPLKGRQDVFWRAPDGYIAEQSEDPYWNEDRTEFPQFGKIGSQPRVVADPALGQEDLFWEGEHSQLWEASYSVAQAQWTGPVRVPHSNTIASAPAVTAWPRGEVDVFWKGVDNNLWEETYAANLEHPQWSGPIKITDTGSQMSEPTVAADPALGTEEVFWQGQDDRLWGTSYSTADQQWAVPTPRTVRRKAGRRAGRVRVADRTGGRLLAGTRRGQSLGGVLRHRSQEPGLGQSHQGAARRGGAGVRAGGHHRHEGERGGRTRRERVHQSAADSRLYEYLYEIDRGVWVGPLPVHDSGELGGGLGC